jgi:hypothetical protein
MWVSHLTMLGERFGGKAALILHDFESQRGEIVDAGENVPRRLRTEYASVAKNHPWGTYMWSKEPGYAIFPDALSVAIRTDQQDNYVAFTKLLKKYDIEIGMGAILWKDRHLEPRFVFAVGVLRPGDPYKGDQFSKEDKDIFSTELVPNMVKHIQDHERVKAIVAQRKLDIVRERLLGSR